MLNLSIYGVTISNPQNIYEAIILGLSYMPKKPVIVATAAIGSGIALYATQPETLLGQVSTILLSSGIAWTSIGAAHQIACQILQKRRAQLDQAHKEYEKTPEGIEAQRQMEEDVRKMLDDLLKDQ